MEACPKIEAVQLPVSYRKTLSKSIQMYLTMQKIAILEGDVWGHRQDICEHKVISQGVFDEIEALTQKKVSPEQISHVVSSKYRLSPSFVEFVMEKKITA